MDCRVFHFVRPYVLFIFYVFKRAFVIFNKIIYVCTLFIYGYSVVFLQLELGLGFGFGLGLGLGLRILLSLFGSNPGSNLYFFQICVSQIC